MFLLLLVLLNLSTFLDVKLLFKNLFLWEKSNYETKKIIISQF